VPQLIRSGKVTRPTLGVQLASDQIMQQLDQKGALIMNVVPDSPAAKAGLKSTRKESSGHIMLGDIIVGIDDTKIESANDVFAALERHKTGDTVTLHIVRDGKPTDVSVTLGTASS
jgi:S1-C subfamily serine protease